MYRAKSRGKAGFVVFDEAMHANAVSRLRMESDLRQASKRGEFRLHYQPIVSLRTGKVTKLRGPACAGTTPTVVWSARMTSSRWLRRRN